MPIRQSRISAVASASGSARWHGRASVAKRYESAARFAGCRPSRQRASPTVSTTVAATRRPVSRIVSLSRNAMSKRALCATSTASPAKREEAADGAATGGARRSSRVAEAGQRRDRRLQPRAGVRERLEPLAQLEPAHADSADLARPRRRRAGGRSSRGRRRRTSRARAASASPAARRERDEVAGPAEARIVLHRLVEQRAREPHRHGARRA